MYIVHCTDREREGEKERGDIDIGTERERIGKIKEKDERNLDESERETRSFLVLEYIVNGLPFSVSLAAITAITRLTDTLFVH